MFLRSAELNEGILLRANLFARGVFREDTGVNAIVAAEQDDPIEVLGDWCVYVSCFESLLKFCINVLKCTCIIQNVGNHILIEKHISVYTSSTCFTELYLLIGYIHVLTLCTIICRIDHLSTPTHTNLRYRNVH